MLNTIEQALQDLQAGKMIILVDDEDRENEGDLVIAAEKITPEAINFMCTHGRGLITVPMMEADFDRLQIPMMIDNNRSKFSTAFGVSFGASTGVTTGISAADRARSIQVAADPQSSVQDIVMPAHLFPLKAKKGGVLVRRGHTEGSTDLARLAGLRPMTVLCEIMNEDGTMAKMRQITEFAKLHQLSVVSIADVVQYRMQHEILVEEIAHSLLPIKEKYQFQIKVFASLVDGVQHVALISQSHKLTEPCLVRIHSECLTGDVFGSNRCDCGEQLQLALDQIAEEGGILLYMRQEGRGIGLANKIKAYALQQNQGLDTVEANHHLGFKADERNYGLAAQILKQLGIQKICLLTNNPHKINNLKGFGIDVVGRKKIHVIPSADNLHYLKTK